MTPMAAPAPRSGTPPLTTTELYCWTATVRAWIGGTPTAPPVVKAMTISKVLRLFTIESPDVAFAQMSFEHIDGRGLGAARGLAYIAHVADMEVDEFAESLEARYAGLSRRLTAIDLAFGFCRPTACVVSAQEGLADVATFATDLDTPGTGREFCVGGHFFVCAPCALRDRNVAKRVVFWRKFVCTRQVLTI